MRPVNNSISSFIRVPAGATGHISQGNGQPIPLHGDGQVDRAVLEQMPEEALTGLEDARLLKTLADYSKREASQLGGEWKVGFYDRPVYSNRGIIGLEQVSTFQLGHREENSQTLKVDWEKRQVSLTSNLPWQQQAHEVRGSFDYECNINGPSVEEAYYLFA